MHIAGTTPRNPFSRFGEHPSRQVAQFHQIFTVSGVLATVCGGVDRLGCRIVQPRMFPPGKEKRTPDSDRAERIEFVGIIDDFGLQRGGR